MDRHTRFSITATMSFVALLLCAPEARAQWRHVFEDFDITEPVNIVGHQWDDTLLQNCRIHDTGSFGILLRDVDNVTIRNCEIHDIAESGIRLSARGSTANVTIEGNSIHDVQGDGIRVAQRSAQGVDHEALRILGNTIRDTGLCCNQGDYHGIYVQSQDFVIDGNLVLHAHDGDGISARSSGVIRNNVVGYVGKSAIAYYGDHRRGPSDRLLVENNIAFENGFYGSIRRAAIHLLAIPNGSFAVRNYEVRFNTVVSRRDGYYALMVSDDHADSAYDVDVYANILANSASARHVRTGPITRESRNLETSTLFGFVSASEPYDFHLQDHHAARGYATGEPSFPATDLDGDPRSAGALDAGADQLGSIVPESCTLQILEPDGGEDLTSNDTLVVRWSGEPHLGTRVGLTLFYQGAALSTLESTENDGEFSADLSRAKGLPSGGGYGVGVFAADDPDGCSDESAATFSID